MSVNYLRRLPARWIYRSRQFMGALLGRVNPAEMEEARAVLGPRLYAVFSALPGQYRLHMLSVYRRVRAAECEDRAVWQAALLHDAGKYDPVSGRHVSLPYRVAFVLLEAVPPGRRVLDRLSRPGRGAHSKDAAPPRGWRYPFYLNKYHPSLGARLAAGHGASENVVRLIAAHHRARPADPQLAALQAADEHT